MAQAVCELVLAYAGFLCAWRPIVAMTGERVARRCGGVSPVSAHETDRGFS